MNKKLLTLALIPILGLANEPNCTDQDRCWDTWGNPVACRDTGQDGEYQTGYAPTVKWFGIEFKSTRFKQVGQNRVRDKRTNLEYHRLQATCFAYFSDWKQALDDVDRINTVRKDSLNCGTGKDDWRLPNINELTAILSYGETDYELVEKPNYIDWSDQDEGTPEIWTSTTCPRRPEMAYTVDFVSGVVRCRDKTENASGWAVRSPRAYEGMGR